ALGDRPLEAIDRRAGGQHVAAQHLGHGGDVILVNELAAVGEEALGHGQPSADGSRSIIARSAAPSSRSGAESLAYSKSSPTGLPEWVVCAPGAVHCIMAGWMT